LPSFILIRPLATIYERHRQTDIQDKTDNDAIGKGEPFYKRSPENRRVVCPEGILLVTTTAAANSK